MKQIVNVFLTRWKAKHPDGPSFPPRLNLASTEFGIITASAEKEHKSIGLDFNYLTFCRTFQTNLRSRRRYARVKTLRLLVILPDYYFSVLMKINSSIMRILLVVDLLFP